MAIGMLGQRIVIISPSYSSGPFKVLILSMLLLEYELETIRVEGILQIRINYLLYTKRTKDQGLFDLLLQKCPFWLEIIAQHAMDYSDVPVVLVGQEMDDGRVAVVGWGNCEGENGSIQQVLKNWSQIKLWV